MSINHWTLQVQNTFLTSWTSRTLLATMVIRFRDNHLWYCINIFLQCFKIYDGKSLSIKTSAKWQMQMQTRCMWPMHNIWTKNPSLFVFEDISICTQHCHKHYLSLVMCIAKVLGIEWAVIAAIFRNAVFAMDYNDTSISSWLHTLYRLYLIQASPLKDSSKALNERSLFI